MHEPDTIVRLPAEQDGTRRDHLRHDVAVPARLSSERLASIQCEIRDLSSTGMYLSVALRPPAAGPDPLGPGSALALRFAPDPEAPADFVEIEVLVMWRTPTAVGVHYADLSPSARAAVRIVARLAVGERIGDDGTTGALTSSARRRVASACRRTVEKALPNMIWALRTELARRLRRHAESASPQDAEAARRDAALVDDKATAIALTIERQFLLGFAQASDLDETQELAVALIRPARRQGQAEPGLDVLEDEDSDRAAAELAAACTAAERYKTHLFELNVRLKDVIGHRMDGDANPLNPVPACRLFWAGTLEHCDSPLVREGLGDAVRLRVVPLLGELYDALHATLDAEGVPAAFD